MHPGGGRSMLEEMAFLESARLFWELALLLGCQPQPISALPIVWGPRICTRAQYAALFADDGPLPQVLVPGAAL